MSVPHVIADVTDRICRITLNRPSSGNRISEELALAFIDLLQRVIDDDVDVVVVTGAGHTFSLGSDKTLAEIGSERAVLRGVAAAAANLSKPLIGAINGDAIGQGLELALACDLRVISEDAKLALDQMSNREIPWDGGTQRLPRLVPQALAVEMLLLGRELSAQDAFSHGLVSQISPPSEVVARSMELAKQLATAAPIANIYAKEAILKGMDLPLDQGLRLEADLAVLLHTSSDREEGIRAFLEKRPAEFTGE